MIIPYIIIGIISILSVHIFSSIYDFELVEVNTIFYKNITNSVPSRPNNSITDSVKARLNELTATPPSPDFFYEPTELLSPSSLEFYRQYMRTYVAGLTKAHMLPDNNGTIRLVTMNNEWNLFEPQSDIGMYVIREERLYGVNPRNSHSAHEWKFCFHHRINGTIEAAALEKESGHMAIGTYNYKTNSRELRYYKTLDCEYSQGITITNMKEKYCNEVEKNMHEPKICNTTDFIYEPTVKFEKDISNYEDLLLNEDSEIQNMAVTDSLVVYTTTNDRGKITYLFRTPDGEWGKDTIKYPREYGNFSFFQNVGLRFLSSRGEKEKRLLIVDIVANNSKDGTDLCIFYSYCYFISGRDLIGHNQSYAAYGVRKEEEIVLDFYYTTNVKHINSQKMSHKLNILDNFRLQHLPNSIMEYNEKSQEMIIVTLEEYVLLVKLLEDDYVLFSRIDDFEDQVYKIKAVDISSDGLHFAFLTYKDNKCRVYVLFHDSFDTGLTELHLLHFDYSLNTDTTQIKDLKLFWSLEHELSLLLALQSGELATYSLQFGGGGLLGGFYDLFLEEESGFLSVFSLIFVITLFSILKFATTTLRRNIVIPRPRPPNPNPM